LFHVGWLLGGGSLGRVRFELRELNTVSVDKNSFDGTYDQKFFDANGSLVFEDTGTILQRAFLWINFNATTHRRSLKDGLLRARISL